MALVPLISASVASFVSTPLLIYVWRHFTPPASASEFDTLGLDALRARNKYLDHLFTALMFVGLVTPLAFIRRASTPTHATAFRGRVVLTH